MKNHPIPSFDDLAVFLIVCKTAGFRAAARQLGLSPSHVSDTIARLEAQLELPLFTRNTRSVMPTDAARALAERMAPLLEETRAVLADVTSAARDIIGFLKLDRRLGSPQPTGRTCEALLLTYRDEGAKLID